MTVIDVQKDTTALTLTFVAEFDAPVEVSTFPYTPTTTNRPAPHATAQSGSPLSYS